MYCCGYCCCCVYPGLLLGNIVPCVRRKELSFQYSTVLFGLYRTVTALGTEAGRRRLLGQWGPGTLAHCPLRHCPEKTLC